MGQFRVVPVIIGRLYDLVHDWCSLLKPDLLIFGALGGRGGLWSGPASCWSNWMFLRGLSHFHQIDQQLSCVDCSVYCGCIGVSEPVLTHFYLVWVIFGDFFA